MPYLAPELLAILCDYLSKSDLLGFARVNKLFSAVAQRRLHRLVPLRLSLGYKRPEPPNSPITTEAWETIRGVEIKLNMTRGSRCTYPTKWSVVSLAPVWGFNGTSLIRGSCHIILNIQDWSHKYLGSEAVTLLSPARFQVLRDNVTFSALIGLTSFEKLVVTIEGEDEDMNYVTSGAWYSRAWSPLWVLGSVWIKGSILIIVIFAEDRRA